jgi:hypothetical protein
MIKMHIYGFLDSEKTEAVLFSEWIMECIQPIKLGDRVEMKIVAPDHKDHPAKHAQYLKLSSDDPKFVRMIMESFQEKEMNMIVELSPVLVISGKEILSGEWRNRIKGGVFDIPEDHPSPDISCIPSLVVEYMKHH